MEFTSVQYVINEKTNQNEGFRAILDGKELQVPFDPANRHYSAILEWASQEGNTIADAD